MEVLAHTLCVLSLRTAGSVPIEILVSQVRGPHLYSHDNFDCRAERCPCPCFWYVGDESKYVLLIFICLDMPGCLRYVVPIYAHMITLMQHGHVLVYVRADKGTQVPLDTYLHFHLYDV